MNASLSVDWTLRGKLKSTLKTGLPKSERVIDASPDGFGRSVCVGLPLNTTNGTFYWIADSVFGRTDNNHYNTMEDAARRRDVDSLNQKNP